MQIQRLLCLLNSKTLSSKFIISIPYTLEKGWYKVAEFKKNESWAIGTCNLTFYSPLATDDFDITIRTTPTEGFNLEQMSIHSNNGQNDDKLGLLKENDSLFLVIMHRQTYAANSTVEINTMLIETDQITIEKMNPEYIGASIELSFTPNHY